MAVGKKAKKAAEALTVLRKKRRLRTIPSYDGGITTVLLLAVIGHGSALDKAKKSLDRIAASVVNWNELRVTQVSDVAACLKDVRDAQAKAAAIHDILTNIFEGTHDLNLGFLKDASADEAADFLTGLGSLTPDMVDEIIISGKGYFHMSVDVDVMRVLRRLDVIGRSASTGKAQAALENLLNAEKAYQLVYLLKQLAESVCATHSPRCAECILAGVCPSARKTRSK